MPENHEDFINKHTQSVKDTQLQLSSTQLLKNSRIDELDVKTGKGFFDVYYFDDVVLSRADVVFREPLQINQPANLNYYGFQVVLTGSMEINFTNLPKPIHATGGQVWWRQCDLGHMQLNLPALERIQIISLDFRYETLEKLLASDLLDLKIHHLAKQQQPLCELLDFIDQRTFYKAHHLANCSHAKNRVDQIKLEGAMMSLLGSVLQNDVEAAKPKTENAVDMAAMIISTECQRKLTIPALARRVGLNECSLKRDFKMQYGMTIGDYIRKQRMSLALDLLNTGCDVRQIAGKTGYCDTHYFTKVFSQYFGYLPQQHSDQTLSK